MYEQTWTQDNRDPLQVAADQAVLASIDMEGVPPPVRQRVISDGMRVVGVVRDLFYSAEHEGGVPWDQAAPPPRLHLCRPHSQEWAGLNLIQHCRCGAVSVTGGARWYGRNSRRRGTRAEAARMAWSVQPEAAVSVVARTMEVHQVEWIDNEVGFDCGCNEYGDLSDDLSTLAGAQTHLAREIVKALSTGGAS